MVAGDAPRFDSEHDRVAHAFGSVLRLLATTERRMLRLASLEAQLMPPIRLQQMLILHGPRRVALAYASWAFVSDDVAEQLNRDPDRLLHLSEWNEGSNLWITDFVATKRRTRELAEALRERHRGAHRSAEGRRDDGRRVFMRLHGSEA